MSSRRLSRSPGIGGRIQQRRQAMSLSGQQVAERAELSVDTVRSIESGRIPNPGILTVAKLARALNASLDELAGHRAARARR